MPSDIVVLSKTYYATRTIWSSHWSERSRQVHTANCARLAPTQEWFEPVLSLDSTLTKQMPSMTSLANRASDEDVRRTFPLARGDYRRRRAIKPIAARPTVSVVGSGTPAMVM